MNRKLFLDDLAESVNLSASRLRHLFKAEIGKTPTQYLRTRRMQEAKNLSDVSRFVRDFKMAFGSTPIKYRVHHYNNNSSNNMI